MAGSTTRWTRWGRPRPDRLLSRAAAASRRTRGWLLRPRDGARAGPSTARARSATTSSTSWRRACEPPAVGDPVTAELDWERRHLLMRTHTALHALCGVVWRDHGALVTGGNMEPGKGRMDFEFESHVAASWSAASRPPSTRSSPPRATVHVALPAARGGVRDPGPHPDQDQPAAARASRRSGSSTSRASTCRPTAARTSPTPARSGASGSPATSRRAASTSASGSSSSTPDRRPFDRRGSWPEG